MRNVWKPLILCTVVAVATLHSAPASARMSECSRAKAYRGWAELKADAICSVMGTGDTSCQEAAQDAWQAELYEGWVCNGPGSEHGYAN